MTITQTVDIPADRRLVIDVPREVPSGKTQVIIQFPVPAEKTEPLKERVFGCSKGKYRMAEDFEAPYPVERTEPLKERVFGCAKGQFKIADDFDAPLEDFKDYM